MTTPRDSAALSPQELVVLARLSPAPASNTRSRAKPKPATNSDLVKALIDLALATTREQAERDLARALDSLRARSLAVEAPAGRKPHPQRWQLTEAGERWLRDALGLSRTPAWSQSRDSHLPALGLGLVPGSEQADRALRTASTIVAAVLGALLGLGSEQISGRTIEELCDAILLEDLGLTDGPVTLSRLRAHCLARRVRRAKLALAGLPPKEGHEPTTAKELQAVVARAIADALRIPKHDSAGSPQLRRALGHCWLYHVKQVHRASSSRFELARFVARANDEVPPELPPRLKGDQEILAAVRDALPRIGSDGRFGAEKVFVYALWRRIEPEDQPSALSLDGFKRWLVMANRRRLVDLARADLVGAMDAQLVARSEIADLGTTFHFVLDHREKLPGARLQRGRA